MKYARLPRDYGTASPGKSDHGQTKRADRLAAHVLALAAAFEAVENIQDVPLAYSSTVIAQALLGPLSSRRSLPQLKGEFT